MRRHLLAWTLLAALPAQAIVELRAEYLYVRPSVCNQDYVVADREPFDQSSPTPRGDVRQVPSSYQSGFRASVGWLDCDTLYNIGFSYTRLHAIDRATTIPAVEGAGLWLTFSEPSLAISPVVSQDLGPPVGFIEARASAKTTFDYDAAELQVGHRSYHNGNFCLRTWGAIHFAHLEHLRRVFLRGIDPQVVVAPLEEFTVDSRSCVWGIGPKIGADFRLAIGYGWGIGGNFSAGLLVGDRILTFREQLQSFDTDGIFSSELVTSDRYPHGLAFFPNLQARLGLNYGHSWGCYTLLIEIGYEWIDYLSTLPAIGFSSQGSAVFTLCQDARLDGLYVAARLEF